MMKSHTIPTIYALIAICIVAILSGATVVKSAISTFNEGIVIGDTTLTSGLLLDVNGKIGANELCDNTNANCVTTAAVYSAVNSSGGSIAGSGTTNYVPKFSTNTSLVSGMMRDTGTMVGVGRAPLVTLDVDGNVAARGGHVYLGSAGNQDIYGDNTSGLYFDSNHSTETQLVLRDADNSIYGRLSGTSNGQYFGLKGPGLSGSYFLKHDDTANVVEIAGDTKFYNTTNTGDWLEIKPGYRGSVASPSFSTINLSSTDILFIEDNLMTNHSIFVGADLVVDHDIVVHDDVRVDENARISGHVSIGESSPDGTLKLDVEGQVGATEYCDENGDFCESAPLKFEINGGSQTSSYQCIHDVDLESHCGDEDGCRIVINMNYKLHSTDQVKTIAEHIYIEQTNFSNNNNSTRYGYTRQEGGGDYSWITGNTNREIMFDPWNWVWMLDYKTTSCSSGGTNAIYTDPYTFTFMSSTGIRTQLFVYDRP